MREPTIDEEFERGTMHRKRSLNWNNLTKAQRRIRKRRVEELKGDGLTQEEIGAKLGITRQRVSQIIKEEIK